MIKAIRGCCMAMVLCLWSSLAQAQVLTLTLDQPDQTGRPGDTILFNATLTNTSATDSISLDGSTPSLTGPGTLTNFFDTLPLLLSPQEVWTGALFNVQIDIAALSGDSIEGNYAIDFTPDSGSSDTTPAIPFTVKVQGTAAAATPEPGTASLLWSSLIGLLALSRRLKRQER